MRMDIIPARDPVRISTRRQSITYGVGIGLWASGVLWLIYHYFMQRKTMFGVEANPLEHWWLALHGLFGFASLWTFGLLWGTHIVGGWKSGRHRISGSVMFLILGWLILSGYLLYYLGEDELLSTVALLHWAVGLVLPLPFVIHRFARSISSGTGRINGERRKIFRC